MWIVQENIDGLWRDVDQFDEESDAALIAGYVLNMTRIIYAETGHQIDLEDYFVSD